MKKLTVFFYVLKRSLTSPDYYAAIIKAPFSFSLKFFYFYFFLYSLIGTAFIIPKLIPLKTLVLALPSKLEKIYPAELEIKIDKGQASTNVVEPYFFSLKDMEKIFQESDVLGAKTPVVRNLLVIDTKALIEDFSAYETLILLTKNNLVIQDKENGGFRVYSLADVPNLTINQQEIKDLTRQMMPWVQKIAVYLVPFLALLIFFGLFLFLPSSLFLTLLFYALLAWFLGKILSFPLTYKKAYQISMHSIILPTTIFGLFSLVSINLSFPFLQTIIMVIMTTIILQNLKKNQGKTKPSQINPPILS